MTVDDVTPKGLAACMALAAKASGAPGLWGDPENEVYWYTRELSFVVARSSGIMWSRVISDLKGMSWATPEELVLLAGELWPEIMHPDLLAREVMES